MGAPDVRRLPVDEGVSLCVRAWPDGDSLPFVLLHGLASNARMWDGVAGALQHHDHPVAAVDLRGHGRSDKPDAGYDMATVSNDVHTVLTTLGWARPVVAGQSWGGNVIVELAHRHPDTVAGVAGVDGGTIELQRRFADWEACAHALAPPATEGLSFAAVEKQFRASHPDWPDGGIAGAMANWEVREDATVAPWLTRPRHMQVLRGLWEQEPSQLLAGLTTPVLLITAGEQPDVRAAAASLRRGRVRALDGDHDLHAQHPDQVAALLHDATLDGFFA